MVSDRVQAGAAADRTSERTPRAGGWRRSLAAVLGCAVVVVAVRALLVQSFVVPTDSMAPTIRAGDRVVISRLTHFTGSVQHGDVIVFDGTDVFDPPAPSRTPLAELGRSMAAAVGVPVGQRDYVKRVIGLPGDRVTCCDDVGRLSVNGSTLAEPYLAAGEAASATTFDVQVPAGRLWVMGDNRDDSADSRAHLGDPGGGTVPLDHVVGTVAGLWWPPSRLGGLGS